MKNSRAFTLFEMLAVLGIISLLTAVAIPSMRQINGSLGLNQAGQIVVDQIAFARQEAISQNKETQIRFFKMGQGSDAAWRAVQVWKVEQGQNGPVEMPLGKLMILPEGVVIMGDSTLSPLLGSNNSVTGQVEVPNLGNLEYEGIRFQASGKISYLTTDNNFLTLRRAVDNANPPVNFYTVQVNSLTGKIGVYRP